MRSSRIRTALACIAALALVPLRAAHAAPCPETCTDNSFDGAHCSTLPSGDVAHSNSCLPYPGFVATHEVYDLAAGTLRVNATSCEFAPVNGFSWVIAHDRFRLVGPAGPDVVAFQARLITTGSAGGFGTVSAGLLEIAGESRSVNDGGQGGFATTLLLPLSHAVGEEFEIAYEVHASAQFTAQAQAQLAFALPPGYGVTSCQGYAGEGAVAARRTTWSAIKSFYR